MDFMIARVLGFTLPKLKRKVKPDDSSTSKPGVEPGLPGQAPDPHSTPPRIMGDDTAGLLVASSKPGDPGINICGEGKFGIGAVLWSIRFSIRYCPRGFGTAVRNVTESLLHRSNSFL